MEIKALKKILFFIFLFWGLTLPFGTFAQTATYITDPPNPVVGSPINITVITEGLGSIVSACFRMGDGSIRGPIRPSNYEWIPGWGGFAGAYRLTYEITAHTYHNAQTYTVIPIILGWALDCGSGDVMHSLRGTITVTGPTNVIVPAGACGDEIVQSSSPPQIEGISEECDCGGYIDPVSGLQLNRHNCSDSKLQNRDCTNFSSDPSDPTAPNFTGGTLSCIAPPSPDKCKFDTSGCTMGALPPTSTPTGLYDNPLLWQNIVQFLLYLLIFIFRLAIGIVVLMILIGSFFLITGGADPIKKEKGKKIIMWAVIGFSIAVLAQGIYQLFKLIMGER